MGRPKKILLDNDNGGEVTDLSGEEHSSEELKIPNMEEPEWQDYIMSLFKKDELYNGYPKAKGFRRIVRVVHGPIIKGLVKLVQAATPANEHRASVEYTVEILKNKGLGLSELPYVVSYSDVADACPENISTPMYKVYSTTIASTRAEVRALRKALNIDIVSAEELPDQSLNTDNITESLITKLDIKCSQLNVNVMKFINQYRGGKKNPLYESITDVPQTAGTAMFQLLNDYQQKDSKGQPKVEIPEGIVGYESNWRVD